eukprot:jgi/Mesen1/3580/ME000020S03108
MACCSLPSISRQCPYVTELLRTRSNVPSFADCVCCRPACLSHASLQRSSRRTVDIHGRQTIRRHVISMSKDGASSADSDSHQKANAPGGNPQLQSPERYRSQLETLYYCDTAIPEEKIEKPKNLKLLQPKAIGNRPRCGCCKQRGVLECPTCGATGLYIDPIMESQGLLFRVRCLGCSGSGTVMCFYCEGRGHN